MRVCLFNSGRTFRVAPGEPLLAAALAAGLNLPHSCQSGNCGACRARLRDGAVSYPNGRPLGLTEAERTDGLILLCQACATNDLCIEVFERVAPEQARTQRLPCRILRVERLAHDVLGVYLQLPPAVRFEFEAGQYVDVLLPGGRRRSFSIASPPHDARPLELHVRRVPGGELTAPLFEGDASGRLLSIEGPLGSFVYRPHAPSGAAAASPLLLIGGGTGLAPLKSLWRHVIENDPRRELQLYWGVRSERDLYAHDALIALAARRANFHYVPVLSEPSAQWAGRRGWVHEAALADISKLDAFDIYASGPPAMIEALRRDFLARGAAPDRLYVDAFDYAPDSLERHRLMAATKS
jgi:CDP-4-dehydro-6-deoxyglucose reductase